jgi:hypothetical protein
MRNLAYMYFGESPDSLTTVRGWPYGNDHDDTINLTLRRPGTASRWGCIGASTHGGSSQAGPGWRLPTWLPPASSCPRVERTTQQDWWGVRKPTSRAPS